MANNTYGIKKPAFITSNDVDIFYHYRPSRNSDSAEFNSFKKLDSSILTTFEGESNDGTTSTLPGMYNLRLPLGTFGKVGIYTVYIKPKEIYTKIADVSTLSSYPDIRGIIIDSSSFAGEDAQLFNNGNLIGYRVEYFNDDQRSGDYRIITSNNRCEPVMSSLSTTIQKGVSYLFNDSGNLIFCTLTPSTSPSYKNSSLPYIGTTSQKIALINTKFNPVMLEIEMTEHDIETVSTMLEGDQLRNLDKAIITTFNNDGGIYNQSAYGHVVSKSDGINADFRIQNNTSILFDEANNLKNIKENI